MLGRYDVWDLDYHKDVLPFQAGIRFMNPEADEKIFWGILFDETESHYQDILSKGELCLEYQTMLNKNYCNSHTFNLTWENHRFLVANSLNNNSQLFESKFNHHDYDAVMTFGFTNGKWSMSMYTDKPNIDVSVIAKKYGGGGHRGACGFQSTILPFNLPYKRQL